MPLSAFLSQRAHLFRRTNIVLAGTFFLVLGSCGPDPGLGVVPGSGALATTNRVIPSFTEIEIKTAASVDVSLGTATSLMVTTDDNLQPLLKTEVSGGTLEIYSSQSLQPTSGIRLRVTTPSLAALSISGSGRIHAEGIKAGTFSIKISGSGDITVQGTADRCYIAVAGAGHIKASDLLTHDARVSIEGTGAVSVDADQSLSASIEGTGSIRYRGNPAQVKKNNRGNRFHRV